MSLVPSYLQGAKYESIMLLRNKSYISIDLSSFGRIQSIPKEMHM